MLVKDGEDPEGVLKCSVLNDDGYFTPLPFYAHNMMNDEEIVPRFLSSLIVMTESLKAERAGFDLSSQFGPIISLRPPPRERRGNSPAAVFIVNLDEISRQLERAQHEFIRSRPGSGRDLPKARHRVQFEHQSRCRVFNKVGGVCCGERSPELVSW